MAFDRRGRRRRALRYLLWGIAALQVLEAVKLRARREQLRALPRSPTPLPDTGELSVSAMEGSSLDEPIRAAVLAEMGSTGARVVDLVPGDIPADRALAFLRRIDFDQLRDDPCYTPSGACEALAVHPSVAERMGLPEGEEKLDRGEMVQRTIDAQRYAPDTRVVRVAPMLRAAPLQGHDRWRELDELMGWTRPYVSSTGLVQGLELGWLALMTAGPWLAPLPGLAALAAWSAQPALVFGSEAAAGSEGAASDDGDDPSPHEAWTPPGLFGASLLRLPRAWAQGLARAAAGARARATATVQADVAREPAKGFEDLFEPRRDTCRWCDSRALDLHVENPDLLQRRQGAFRLERCRDCGHVFQNPQLTAEGLDLAYSHAYGDAGGETAEWCQARMQESYRGRVKALGQFTQPKRWLDVGCSYGIFFLVARRAFPGTTFEGLDMSEELEEGRRRGWVDTVHNGFFLDLVDSLPSYDVVSMHHYLEHTCDPGAELAAVDKVLEPGGHLMIELPDPESPWTRRLGRFWWQWGQPQHLNFMPCDNMVARLTAMGYEVLSVERGGPSMGNELVFALLLWAQSKSRPTSAPWLPPATLKDRVQRAAAMSAIVPLLPVARLIDVIDDARIKRTDSVSNVYRLVARKGGL